MENTSVHKMKNSISILIKSVVFLILTMAFSVQAKQPNIIVFLADDLGYNDVGFTGETDIQTPNIDKLANNGVIFSNGYATHPYCGPSRAGLLTGRYQARFGMENNVTYAPEDKYMGLPLTEKTFPKRLQESGYNTAIFGKWHMGAAPHFQPNQRGFDYFYGFLDGGHHYMPEQVAVASDGYSMPIMRNTGVAEFDEYLTTALSRDAVNYIGRNKDKPFFMYMSYNAPHAPLQAPKSYIDKYSHIKDENRRIYAAMVDAMDDGIGMIVNKLEQDGLLDNTLIFFLSDNGGVYPEEWLPTFDWADNSPFRRGKVALLEGGIHVPFIAHWPDRIEKGSVFNGLVSTLDIAATSLALANADIADAQLDGVNLVPYMSGEKTTSPHHALYWRLEEAEQIYAVRTETSKYMSQPLPDVGRSFFNMVDDPAESTNLIDQNVEKQAELAELWNKWNSKNISSLLLQSWEYTEVKRKFYEQLHKDNVKAAKEATTYTIK